MKFEAAKNQIRLGYPIARKTWDNKRCLQFLGERFFDITDGEILRPSFQKSRLTIEDIQADDWIVVKLARKKTKRIITPGFGDWTSQCFSRILSKTKTNG
ncbi:hypothetical protein EBU94_02275 [bacterium]|nr:hypothetical protein [bacterium]